MSKPTVLPDGIVIPSSTDFLADVDRYLEEKFSAAGVDPSIMTDIAISVSELVNNAISHGNGGDPDKSVEVRYSIVDGELHVIVSDEGGGFDVDGIPDPVDDDNLLREVGRGIFIVRNFVDELHITEAPSGGTRVEIVKKLQD